MFRSAHALPNFGHRLRTVPHAAAMPESSAGALRLAALVYAGTLSFLLTMTL